MINKGRRNELTLLKFKKRLTRIGLWEKINDERYHLFAYKSHGKPCSCYMCKADKFREKSRRDFKNFDRNHFEFFTEKIVD
ncbi:MAG: hypothetical protein QM564_12570 [Bergeyella sp.]